MAKTRRKKDQAEQQTDELLEELEKRIAAEYSVALKEIREKYDKFAEKFKDQDEKKKEDLKNGKITQGQYNKWRTGRLFTDERYRKLQKILAEDLTKTNQKAMSIANGYMPDAYAINFNYSTYEIEQGVNINTNFTLYSRETVEKLVREGSVDLPKRKVDIPADLLWNRQHINSAILQGVLQGESIPDISKRLQQVTDMNRRAAVRNARTMMTGAQNGGRIAAYERADDLGIKIQKEWMATLDSRTRDSHQEMDGKRVDWKKPFENGLMYPGDPSGDPAEVYNCRCTLVPFYPEYADTMAKRMTYSEWIKGKEEESAPHVNPNRAEIDSFINLLKGWKIKENPIKKMENGPLDIDDYLKKVAGGDMTNGSCASLAFCFIGNEAGFDMRDFRGGESRGFFARTGNLNTLTLFKGIDGIVEKTTTEVKTGIRLIKENVQEGKTYFFGIGRHVAIVKKEGDLYYYLEQQSGQENGNGWKVLNTDRLRKRFGCTMKSKYLNSIELFETSKMANYEGIDEIFAYINTDEEEQKKGIWGGLK